MKLKFPAIVLADKNPRKVQAVMDAMMTMVKLDVAALEKAHDAAF